jgi:hypothetical protein
MMGLSSAKLERVRLVRKGGSKHSAEMNIGSKLVKLSRNEGMVGRIGVLAIPVWSRPAHHDAFEFVVW